jgi:predicted DNA-binding transcriptional regulator YafY
MTKLKLFTGSTWPALLTPDERDSIWLGCILAQFSDDQVLVRASKSIVANLEKARQAAFKADHAVIEAGVAKTLVQTTGKGVNTDLLRRALIDEMKLHISYSDRSAKATTRTVWPVNVSDYGPNGSLLAWCEKRSDFRHFRFDRIKSIDVIQERIPTPRRVLASQFDLKNNDDDDY